MIRARSVYVYISIFPVFNNYDRWTTLSLSFDKGTVSNYIESIITDENKDSIAELILDNLFNFTKKLLNFGSTDYSYTVRIIYTFPWGESHKISCVIDNKKMIYDKQKSVPCRVRVSIKSEIACDIYVDSSVLFEGLS